MYFHNISPYYLNNFGDLLLLEVALLAFGLLIKFLKKYCYPKNKYLK